MFEIHLYSVSWDTRVKKSFSLQHVHENVKIYLDFNFPEEDGTPVVFKTARAGYKTIDEQWV